MDEVAFNAGVEPKPSRSKAVRGKAGRRRKFLFNVAMRFMVLDNCVNENSKQRRPNFAFLPRFAHGCHSPS